MVRPIFCGLENPASHENAVSRQLAGYVAEARSATAMAIDLCRKCGSVAMLERAEAIVNEIESATV